MTRIFDVDGRQMAFSFSAFNTAFSCQCKEKHLSVRALEESLANDLGVSYDTVHNWHCKKNGPIDLEMVKNISSALNLQDYTTLLSVNCALVNGTKDLTDRQKTAAKKIYDKTIWFLTEFEKTDGFNEYWLRFKELGAKNPEEASYEKVESMIADVFLVYEQEYFDLHSHPIYEELGDFLRDGLYVTFDGKLSYGYRFEAIPDGNPTTNDDYNKAMIALNSIIDKYI